MIAGECALLQESCRSEKWDLFKKAMDSGEIVTVRGLELNKGGMIVSMKVFVDLFTTSQFGKSVMNELEALLGKAIRVKVIEVDREKNRLIFSERHVSEEELIKQKTAALDAIKIGETYEGLVSGILPFGAFVTLTLRWRMEAKDTSEGLVHISEISWEKVEDPRINMSRLDTRFKANVLLTGQVRAHVVDHVLVAGQNVLLSCSTRVCMSPLPV